MARRLLGSRAGVLLRPDAPIPAAAAAWAGTAAYLMSRVQSTPNQKPGRNPDMSEAAGAAAGTETREAAATEAGLDSTLDYSSSKTAAEQARLRGYPAIAEYLTNEAPRVQVYSTHRARAAP